MILDFWGRCSRRRWLQQTLLGLAGTGLALSAAPRQALAAEATPGTSRRSVREQAKRLIPLSKLDEQSRALAETILGDVSIYRRLPLVTAQCDPHLYRFLVDHPEIVVSMWETLGLSQFQLHPTGEQSYRLDDRAGTQGDVQVLYRSAREHLVYATGAYAGPLIRGTVVGECLLLLHSDYFRETDGAPYVRCRLDSFVRFPDPAAELLARTMQPFVIKAADHNFRETVAFIERVSQTSAANLGQIERVAGRLEQVPDDRRAAFVEVARESHRRHAQLVAARRDGLEGGVARRPGETLR